MQITGTDTPTVIDQSMMVLILSITVATIANLSH